MHEREGDDVGKHTRARDGIHRPLPVREGGSTGPPRSCQRRLRYESALVRELPGSAAYPSLIHLPSLVTHLPDRVRPSARACH